MDYNFRFKTRHVSIVQRSSSVVNSFASSVELIQAMTYKLKRYTIQNFEKLTYNFKMRETSREDKRDREGIPHTHPDSIGNSSRVIFKTTDPKGD